MKRFLPVLVLALGACQALNPGSDSAGTPAGTVSNSDQVQALNQVSSAATTTSQVGAAAGKTGLAKNAAAVAQVADGLSSDLSGKSAAQPVAVDASKRFEYADVYTSLGDPEGMRALVPYLLHPETWMLIKCEMLSATDKHYRFQKLVAGDGRALPEVDIFKGRK
jgi:hypothetical protein